MVALSQRYSGVGEGYGKFSELQFSKEEHRDWYFLKYGAILFGILKSTK